MKGKIIAVGNFKGGVGKSLISYLLYKHFSDSYGLIQSDLDVISDNILHIADFDDFKSKKDEIREILNNKNLIIDTGGFYDDLQNYFFKKSNLIVIPLFLDNLSIKRTFLFLKFLNTLNVNSKKLIVINKYNKEQEDIKTEFINYTKENYGITDFFTLNNYKSFEKVINTDINLIEQNKKNKILYKNAVLQLQQLNNKIKGLLK